MFGLSDKIIRSSFGLTSVGEEQGGVIQRYGGGGVDIQMVVLLDEEVQKGLPDLLGCLGRVHLGLTYSLCIKNMTPLQQS